MYRIALLLLIACLGLNAQAIAAARKTGVESVEVAAKPADIITRHEYTAPHGAAVTPYLLYAPAKETLPAERSLLIFLYGAGGSIENYNFKRPPYASLRAQLADRGYYVVVPDLGKQHFMNDAAKATLDGVVAEVLVQQHIPADHVHVMGTSMGAGSSLAYALHRPELIRSVCAVMPMTDFATWVLENPHYAKPVAKAYGGTYAERPEAYDRNSAIKNADVFKNIPVMLVHGNADDTVIYENSQRLTELFQGKNFPCTLFSVEGEGHNDEVMSAFQDQAMAFFVAAVQDKSAESLVGPLDYKLSLETIYPPYDGTGAWFQPRPVAIPRSNDSAPTIVMTIQRAIGSDYFTGLAVSRTDDLGETWTTPEELAQLGWRDAENGLKMGVCDFTQAWHAPTGKVIGIGHTVRYTDKGFAGYGNRRDSAYAIYDPKTDVWSPWTVLEMPKTEDDKYFFNGVHGQWLVEPDGSLLVPIYYVGPNQPFLAKGVVARFLFEGTKLTFVERGPDLLHDVKRGLYEKSLTFFQGKYYMTMRNDVKGFVAMSDDGLNFGPIKAWTFDDGSELGSYNTQQKWVTHSDGLFLVYTRRGANNDHIMRHRAPLFIAQVDPERRCVIRATERIAVPEAGEMLGNFDATTINENETWITVAGGSAFCARIRWERPNALAGRVN